MEARAARSTPSRRSRRGSGGVPEGVPVGSPRGPSGVRDRQGNSLEDADAGAPKELAMRGPRRSKLGKIRIAANSVDEKWPNRATHYSQVHGFLSLFCSFHIRSRTSKPIGARTRLCQRSYRHLCAEICFWSTFPRGEVVIRATCYSQVHGFSGVRHPGWVRYRTRTPLGARTRLCQCRQQLSENRVKFACIF